MPAAGSRSGAHRDPARRPAGGARRGSPLRHPGFPLGVTRAGAPPRGGAAPASPPPIDVTCATCLPSEGRCGRAPRCRLALAAVGERGLAAGRGARRGAAGE